MFSREEINELGLDQLSETELDRTFEAFNGFAAFFGRAWIEGYFGGARSAYMVRAIVNMWNDWALVKILPGSDELAKRWRMGINEQGVQSELRTFSRLLRSGAEVELFPEVGARIPDCRIRLDPGKPSVYLEVSQRGLSKIRQRGEEALNRVSIAAGDAVAGRHGKVAILKIPTSEELVRIEGWLGSTPRSGDRLGNLAEFFVDALESAIGPGDVLYDRVPEPRLCCIYLTGGEKGTACLGITDDGAQEVLEAEASQLPKDEPGAVVLDVTRVIGGPDEWVPLIQRRFQPTLNTRISAVALMSAVLEEQGVVTFGQVLVNPYAKNPIPPTVVELLERVVAG